MNFSISHQFSSFEKFVLFSLSLSLSMSDTQADDSHPLLYRNSINSPTGEGNAMSHTDRDTHDFDNGLDRDQLLKEAAIRSGSKDKDKKCWDCYPQLVRNIENRGTPEQVEKLHELEHQSPKT